MKTQQAVKLQGNFNALHHLEKGNVLIETITSLFNNVIFKENKVTKKQIQTLIDLAEPLKTRSIPKSMVTAIVLACKELRGEEE